MIYSKKLGQARMHNLGCKKSCKRADCRRVGHGIHPSPPTEKIFRITDSNIRELCEIEVLDFNKKPAELALVPLL